MYLAIVVRVYVEMFAKTEISQSRLQFM